MIRTKRPPQQNVGFFPNTHPHLPVQNPPILPPEHLQVHGGAVLPHLDPAADFPVADNLVTFSGVVSELGVLDSQEGGEEGADLFRGGFAGWDGDFGGFGLFALFGEFGGFFGVVCFFVGEVGGVVVGGGGGGGEVVGGAAGSAVDAG